ncbi:MAG: glycosyltransferase [Deltaproteobacteria bacterium]|nr:glycosyltransferase [Deltaproteobacteria bacterium]
MAVTFIYLSRLESRVQAVPLFHPESASLTEILIWASAVAVGFGVLVWRIYLVVTYKATPSVSDEELPVVSVIIPAYNEGPLVRETILSVAASNYPAEKLQIVSVDDGSKDDTWEWMELAGRELGPRVELVKQPKNGGKRKALLAGFLRSRGEVLVTIDSDCLVEADTIRNLVSPFVVDAKVGGVAGNVRVLNKADGILPRMLDVVFTYSFDYVRAAQSRVNTVMCTPGALSAYRASVILPVMDEWMNQTFFGRPATIGEDRALTNLILRSGFHVRFQGNSIVYTKVPTKHRGLCKMFMRWGRSNVRESIVMTGFLFTKFREDSALGARINLLLHIYQLTVGEVLKFWLVYYLIMNPLGVGLNLIIAAVVSGMIPALLYWLKYRGSENLWIFLYGVYFILGLFWISFVALVTCHRSGWLTRDLATAKAPAPMWQRAGLAFGTAALSLALGSGFSLALRTGPVLDERPVQQVAQANRLAVNNVSYSQVTDRGTMWELNAAEAALENGHFTFKDLELVFDKGTPSETRLTAQWGELDPADGQPMALYGKVQARGLTASTMLFRAPL